MNARIAVIFGALFLLLFSNDGAGAAAPDSLNGRALRLPLKLRFGMHWSEARDQLKRNDSVALHLMSEERIVRDEKPDSLPLRFTDKPWRTGIADMLEMDGKPPGYSRIPLGWRWASFSWTSLGRQTYTRIAFDAALRLHEIESDIVVSNDKDGIGLATALISGLTQRYGSPTDGRADAWQGENLLIWQDRVQPLQIALEKRRTKHAYWGMDGGARSETGDCVWLLRYTWGDELLDARPMLGEDF